MTWYGLSASAYSVLFISGCFAFLWFERADIELNIVTVFEVQFMPYVSGNRHAAVANDAGCDCFHGARRDTYGNV